MRYFRHVTKENKVTLYPFVCWHVGAPQADYEFIHEMVLRLKDDPYGKGVYMGDGGECVTKSSKGSIYEQTMSPQEQKQWLVNTMTPIKDKILFGVKGNHGNRTFKESGLSFDESLCSALGVPYLGTAVFWNLVVGRSSYDIYTNHGVDSGVNTGTKINKAKVFENLVEADTIMTAHSHICAVIPPVRRAHLDNAQADKMPIRWRTTYGYVCGCAYDSRTGYAEDHAYPPLLPAHIAITFSGDTKAHKREQTYEIFNVDANKARQPNREDITSRMHSGEARCPRHPEYQAIRQPQIPCADCWYLYVSKHP